MNDYPTNALRLEQEGVVGFNLSVNTDGTVRECIVTKSSGHSDLDTTTCELIVNRAKFTIPRENHLNESSLHYSNSVRWTIPKEPNSSNNASTPEDSRPGFASPKIKSNDELWGDFKKLIGKVWCHSIETNCRQYDYTDSSHSKINVTYLGTDNINAKFEYVLNAPETDGLIYVGYTISKQKVYLTPGGEILIGKSSRLSYFPDGTFALQRGTYYPKIQYFKVESEYGKLSSISFAEFEQLRDRSRKLAADNSQSSGGGIFGFLGKVNEAYTLMTDDHAYTSAVVGALNDGTPGLGSAVGIVSGAISGNQITSGNEGEAASSGLSRSDYRTRPNLALNICPGFTDENYKQRAFEGGGDTQLFTMCGQAFEYYAMYKRAIAQGYSEADANRTYAAHEKATINADNFAKNWSAK